ncbi:MAG TPA: hypothetical protein VL979_11520 [Solirubrobacteraceae bacterium]|nr:hypothetical protein [Solirubrobacteraceae bacterium]
MYTDRDAEIVGWIGGLGAAGAEHVMARFGMGRSWAYARLSRLVVGGLLEQRALLYRQPGLYLATGEGLRWHGLERLGVYRVGPGGFQHAWVLAGVAAALYRGLPGWGLLSERELRVVEVERRELVGSVRVGELPGGRPALHRPDLVAVGLDGRRVAVEVELSVKAPRRLAAVCQGYARARHIEHAYYLATAPVARAVERAVAEVRAGDRVTVLGLSDVALLSRLAWGEASHARV